MGLLAGREPCRLFLPSLPRATLLPGPTVDSGLISQLAEARARMTRRPLPWAMNEMPHGGFTAQRLDCFPPANMPESIRTASIPSPSLQDAGPPSRSHTMRGLTMGDI